jgi:hypothetical protein
MPRLEDWTYLEFTDMITCEEAPGLFDQLISGEAMDPEIKGALLGHLETCDTCSEAFTERLETALLTGEIPPVEIPAFEFPPAIQPKLSAPHPIPLIEQFRALVSASFFKRFTQGLALPSQQPTSMPMPSMAAKFHWYLAPVGHARGADTDNAIEERLIVNETETAEKLLYKVSSSKNRFYITIWSPGHELVGRQVRFAYRAPGVTEDPLITDLTFRAKKDRASVQAELRDDRLPPVKPEKQEFFLTPPLLVKIPTE